MMLMKDNNVIITGCARGIGRAMLEVFAVNGANIWACVRKASDETLVFFDNLAREHNVRITPVYFDLENADQIKAAVQTIVSAKLPVHALVNNAGITYNALFQMTSMDKMRKVFDVNFFSQFLFTQYIVKSMVRQKYGSIVNVSSTSAIDANSGRGAYGASKAALICVTKAMAAELAEYGVRANAIAPGITETDMVAESMSSDVIKATIAQTKLKRIGRPGDIANTALYLASSMSSYITGQVIRVDGGLSN
jgi:3-oxoacyl-[acyl-carrier protein] reductase